MNLITDAVALDAFCKKIQTEDSGGYVTVDTEFRRVDTYWSQLCLVQIAGSQRHAVIDALAVEMAPVLDLLADKNILKVFHAGRQDIEIFYQLNGKIPTPLFDTQVAAMFCGLGESVGYDFLVQHFAKTSIDKSSQFTDWTRRPLTDIQLQYAAGDVTYLRTIYKGIVKELENRGVMGWIQEELLSLEDPSLYAVDVNEVWKRIKLHNPKPQFLAKIKRLASARETVAQNKNIPKLRLVKDQALIDIATKRPKSPQQLAQIPGVSNGVAFGKLGQQFISELQSTESLAVHECPSITGNPGNGDSAKALTELLKALLKSVCTDFGLSPRLVANTEDLRRLAGTDEPTIRALQGWRYEVFGKQALALKQGKLAMSVDGDKVKLVEI